MRTTMNSLLKSWRMLHTLSTAPAIESPGLTSSPAIGERVAQIVSGLLYAQKNPAWNGSRKGVLNPKTLSEEDYAELIRENPAYGNIICRCEMITEGEILDAIHRPLGARSLDGVKRPYPCRHGTLPRQVSARRAPWKSWRVSLVSPSLKSRKTAAHPTWSSV